MVGTNQFSFSKPRETPWNLRSRSRSITQEELAKRPDPFCLPNLLDGLEDGLYGRLADDVKRLCKLRQEYLNGSISLEDIEARQDNKRAKSSHNLIIDSDDELPQESPLEKRLKKLKEVIVVKNGDSSGSDSSPQGYDEEDSSRNSTDIDNQSLYVDAEEEEELWRKMAFAQESIKVTVEDSQSNDHKQIEDCDHSFICKDDIGEVCRVCGLIKKPIESMIEVVFNKQKRSRRTYMREKENGETSRDFSGIQSSHTNILGEKMFIHPWHDQEMRPHQTEGFRFLCNNLAADEPGGCILAHAPGSGKTFLLISFLQSFMAMDPQARPLVVLPKGIIESWKREFTLWEVEKIPLLDFYSVKAESRKQQLKVLGQWIKERSILFLGYQQFTRIICDDNFEAASEDCKLILLEKPTLLILDEGHTSRNKETYMLSSLARVKTRRKVVLTGTLFQNNVEEVFNILDLVRPKFLKRPGTREIVSRIMSKAEIPRGKQVNQSSSSIEGTFFAAVELTLQRSTNFSAKASLIKDLREMTRNILHYHKADFSGLLPGLSEFTVMLNLSSIQRDEVKGLRKMELFKQISLGAALYIHPKLKSFLEENPSNGEKGFSDNNTTVMKLDKMLKKINVRDGVKMKFFLNLLALCESTGEKLLVFSQYIVPIKTLERLMSSMKGWRLGKEMFTITGDSSNEQREWSMERFNNSLEAKVFFGSIKACGEGISLVGASRVLILDVHLNPSVTQQAVARAYRPGQKRKVYAYKLVAADSPEEENYETCTRKEMMSKMWFEWNVGSGREDFGFRAIDADHSGDAFLETTKMKEDIKCLYTKVN
ncbi:chromatin remodeling 34 [Arabidopsis thaliana]|uniref:Chromatin remodeling 34 n=1 Tax=Arabidopsis thaliana TaxID=3702 RepID=A0A1P8B2I9_ARATH|nr:chromatin remodeling 34 [Arabidopsis thaliana]ANM63098.1 chromatin remodeling 34 [Arabidopsis thaliana]|eukprot:NP_001325209.1 chromatin remodeling 34 [Arabidopsis thaliana]